MVSEGRFPFRSRMIPDAFQRAAKKLPKVAKPLTKASGARLKYILTLWEEWGKHLAKAALF